MNKVFNNVAGNRPSLNRFDLSYTNITSMSLGYLYPVQCDEVYPNSVWKMSAFCHAEVASMIRPLMSDLQLFAHVFFVPYRLLYGVDAEDGQPIWEKFITGGKTGDYDTPLPAWNPSDESSVGFSSKLIWDYIGNPMSYNSLSGTWSPLCPDDDVLSVSIAPKRAYNFIVNEYYRDENLQEERDLDTEDLFVVSFKKDYFTSALEDQQRGTSPALPVNITIEGNSAYPVSFLNNPNDSDEFKMTSSNSYVGLLPVGTNPSYNLRGLSVPNNDAETSNSSGYSFITASVTPNISATATSFTPAELRLAFAIQRMMELSQRAGYRYTEFLQATFNASPTDSRLDRPEYIGGCIMPISVSPLVQTSETSTTPQGNKSGIGHVDSVQKLGNYRVLEHGLIMTLVSIRPKPIYQQGINRQWLRQGRWDFYDPALAFLSEQNVYGAELFVDGLPITDEHPVNKSDKGTFGYQAHWNEMRCKNNIITGAVREQLEYYALGRKFANRPALNSDFLQIKDSDFSYIFAVQNEDHFVVSWSSLIDAYLPLPQFGAPGLIDHVYGGY